MEAEARPQKRMRLGTKSCMECRRRKVRCIYPPNTKICKECALHEVQCTAQTPQQSRHMTSNSSDDVTSMRRRLEELEGMVRSLCRLVGEKVESSGPGAFELTPDSLPGLRQRSIPSDSSPQAGINVSDSDSCNGTSTSTETFEDAPLLNLFKSAMLIEKSEIHGNGRRLGLSAQSQNQACIKAITELLPSLEDLTSILETTEKYWLLWNAFPKGGLPDLGSHKEDVVATVRSFILNSIRSDNAIAVAKSALFLALCIQQLPARFEDQRPSLPSLNTLLDSFMAGAETLLLGSGASTGTLDGLDCFGLQARLQINMGKPRSAWLCFRRAMSHAILQGFHVLDVGADERQHDVWSHIWQYDRQVSLILGLPPAIPSTHPSVSRPLKKQCVKEQAFFDLAVIAGRIIERNQDHRNSSYSMTQEIEQQLIHYKTGPASNLLDIAPTPSMPLQAIYGIQTAKMFYHNLCKVLHLPYMLKSSTDNKYEHNRRAALEAAREVIKAWQDLRACCGQETLIICDLMDFQVFAAAISLVINLLSMPCLDDTGRQLRDWELVHDTSRSLKRVSEVMRCNVAGQAAQLLDQLSAAHQGAYKGQDTYEATIPFFGRVRISKVKKVGSSWVEDTPSDHEADQKEIFSNTVEFSADSFVPFSPNYVGDYLTEAELGVDWTAVLSTEIDYDWSKTFDSSIFGMN